MKPEMKKLIIANLPYLLFVYLFGKLGHVADHGIQPRSVRLRQRLRLLYRNAAQRRHTAQPLHRLPPHKRLGQIPAHERLGRICKALQRSRLQRKPVRRKAGAGIRQIQRMTPLPANSDGAFARKQKESFSLPFFIKCRINKPVTLL